MIKMSLGDRCIKELAIQEKKFKKFYRKYLKYRNDNRRRKTSLFRRKCTESQIRLRLLGELLGKKEEVISFIKDTVDKV